MTIKLRHDHPEHALQAVEPARGQQAGEPCCLSECACAEPPHSVAGLSTQTASQQCDEATRESRVGRTGDMQRTTVVELSEQVDDRNAAWNARLRPELRTANDITRAVAFGAQVNSSSQGAAQCSRQGGRAGLAELVTSERAAAIRPIA